ncbi:hypothetical protein HN51_047326 [Arachis hypogaea]|uniref:Pectate lyase n=1 Tax=Arachis hypogaea TaxID=3818 RepID=A0A445AGA9_ARAHY|nr:uncharacterized protein LOC107625217 isoform X2 [Arachis ipaensis]XP_025632763.1 uncharacterized protein LOC112727291 isoform X1 [Arachis hypogaea]QHO23660.1 putative pectate lyase [Arachis hypogaea]RYR25450.1 hypothetical protein Ahy_B02g059209 [Arachis hypogaea]
MGNSHSHRKHRNSLSQNNNSSSSSVATPPHYKYGAHHYPQQQHNNRTMVRNKVSLPYGRVDTTLRELAAKAEGFGRFAIGGLHGPLYRVTSLADDGPGSLRDACRRKEPLWIVFEVSGTIHLSSYLNVSSYKTIDGRGQRIKLTGKGLRLKECEHVIVCNLEFEGGRGPDVDAIQIKPNSKHIWIDRCTLCDFEDGLIDITRESTDITISRCHFSKHDKTILIGADPSHVGDRCIRVTIHHCFFDGTRQRHPRVRFAKVHLYNNYTRNWGIYAACASVESQIFSQHNIYEAGQKKVAFKYLSEKAADKGAEASGRIISEGDLFINGAQSGLIASNNLECNNFHPREHYLAWTVEPPSDDLKQVLQHCTGWQSMARPLDQTVEHGAHDEAVPIYPFQTHSIVASLPYARVDSSLRALAGSAEGFGHFAIGGLRGPLYHVTTLADDGPGSLRDACRRKDPLWIVFQVSGTIHLSTFLSVSSYKTIDGRGRRIKLTGKGLRLKECEHVIVCNLEFEGGRGPDSDAIQIKPNSKHIWIDRCSLSDFDDGLIDITRESTDITISRCHFSKHNKTILIGADPSHVGDRCIRVTIHHCFFDETRQRHPRVRFAKVHIYNNYSRNWGIYAVCASVESQIFSQHNIYEAGQKKVAFKYLSEKAADKGEEASGRIISEGDMFINGAQSGLMTENNDGSNIFHPSEYYPTWTMEPSSDNLKQVLQYFTGWQSIARPED